MSRHNLVKSIWIFFFGVWLQAVAISDSCYISCLFANITLRATQTRVDFCCLCVPVFPILWCFSHKQLPWHAHQSIYNSMYARLFNPLSTVQLAVNLIILCSLSTKKKNVPDITLDTAKHVLGVETFNQNGDRSFCPLSLNFITYFSQKVLENNIFLLLLHIVHATWWWSPWLSAVFRLVYW